MKSIELAQRPCGLTMNRISHKLLSSCFQDRLGNSIANYTRLQQDIHQFKASMKAGYPFTVGFVIYSLFCNRRMPTKDEIGLENPTLHAVLAVGYDDDA